MKSKNGRRQQRDTGEQVSRRAKWAFLLCPFLLAGTFATAQTANREAISGQLPSDTPTFSVEAHLVTLDVVVLDEHNRPVSGLQRSDFLIDEDHVPQAISQFEPHLATTQVNDRTPPLIVPGAASNYAYSIPSDALEIILLDNLNTELHDQEWVRHQIVQYLQNVKPGTRLALYSMGTKLLLLQGFTQNPQEILSALNGVQGLPVTSPFKNSLGHVAPVRVDKHLLNASRKAFQDSLVSRDYSPERAEYRTYYSDMFLRQLIANLAPLHGRKNILWFSGDFPFTLEPDDTDNNSSVAQELQAVTDLLTESQISIYPVDANGISNDPSAMKHLTMSRIAEDTGGKAFFNTNAITQAMSAAIEDGENYYSLAYVPTNRDYRGKFRHIHVACNNPAYHLAYPRGYYAVANPEESAVRKTEAYFSSIDSTAFLHGAPNLTGILFSMNAEEAPQEAPQAANHQPSGATDKSYLIDFHLWANELQFHALPDGSRSAKLQITTVAYAPDGKKLNDTNNSISINMDNSEKAMKSALSIKQKIQVPTKGGVYFRAVIHDLNSRKTGSVELAKFVGSAR